MREETRPGSVFDAWDLRLRRELSRTFYLSFGHFGFGICGFAALYIYAILSKG